MLRIAMVSGGDIGDCHRYAYRGMDLSGDPKDLGDRRNRLPVINEKGCEPK